MSEYSFNSFILHYFEYMVNVDQTMILFHTQSPQHSNDRSKIDEIVEAAGFNQVCIESFFQYI